MIMTEISNPNPNPDIEEIQIISQEFSFSGPLPPPQVLASYDKIVPGSAAKIIDATMHQSQHRMELESKFVQWDCSSPRT